MSHDRTQNFPEVTEQQVLQALLDAHNSQEHAGRLRAFNPVQYAGLAKKLVKQVPTLLTVLSALGVPIPPTASNAAALVVDYLTRAGALNDAIAAGA